ncbi:DUF1045 domain-containing protein [Methylobacterium dankookense]|uniref:Phosphonate metabolism protein n=1 Tax=Methylobacterium dankookense TaxID=560405 RepID=A0A564FVD7_9HYPH|nr:DUF1045 domain-containing protein [Methylobacterium dankookense]GJD54979.1 hypothetical protein IFDJLNFL_0860 [Methylobacterium dankookense]VUF11977.1 hypothetical protein MTDSW087_01664 [Methylobacterium dankookense]
MTERDAPSRYALYYTPPAGSPLAAFGESVFGGALPGLAPEEGEALAALAAGPRVYGFHATLKAPMRLAPGIKEAALEAACRALAAHRAPLRAGPLEVARLGVYLALVPASPPPALGLFAAECVAALDPFRARLSEAERRKRRPDLLDPRRRALLERWGYPDVFEAFRFHMTLLGPLAPEEQEHWHAHLSEAFAGSDLVIDAVTLLRQDGDGPFREIVRIPFTG